MTSEDPQLAIARRIALQQLESRQRSEAELRKALTKRGTPEHIVDQIIDRFIEVGLINDHEFAQALTSTRLAVQRRGALRIEQELRSKGIRQEIISQALVNIDDEHERDAALAFAKRRARSLQHLEPHVARRRLLGALARRGFSPQVVRQVTNEVLLGTANEHYYGELTEFEE